MNNIFILFIFLYFLMSKKDNINKNQHVIIHEYKSLDVEGTYEKIEHLRKIGPYFPEWLAPILNKSILLTEKIVKFHELTEFLQRNTSKEPITPMELDNNKQRFNYIVSTLKEEIPEEKLNEMGTPMNLILNYEKYKLMMGLMSQVLSNPQKINDKDQLTKLAESLFDGKNEKEKEKMKEMLKMIEIMKVLDSSKKKDPKKD
ncbi:hypothetical protein [Anaerosalibacter sp. Marseille-P3206]|uniref:hypothetical protein n=1 Tax=Anaerosalibacter sp. Marseille-P3206 TaxID=1871005 RepID=UPI00098693F9|nr:hypothetical protein [Anaerosalibacter sp. Marseille-P3206]